MDWRPSVANISKLLWDDPPMSVYLNSFPLPSFPSFRSDTNTKSSTHFKNCNIALLRDDKIYTVDACNGENQQRLQPTRMDRQGAITTRNTSKLSMGSGQAVSSGSRNPGSAFGFHLGSGSRVACHSIQLQVRHKPEWWLRCSSPNCRVTSRFLHC